MQDWKFIVLSPRKSESTRLNLTRTTRGLINSKKISLIQFPKIRFLIWPHTHSCTTYTNIHIYKGKFLSNLFFNVLRSDLYWHRSQSLKPSLHFHMKRKIITKTSFLTFNVRVNKFKITKTYKSSKHSNQGFFTK